jgi:hypothetical protein
MVVILKRAFLRAASVWSTIVLPNFKNPARFQRIVSGLNGNTGKKLFKIGGFG